jgi:HD-GYP domain-containing protein (c-di-GMP phosphodiesterase class II)
MTTTSSRTSRSLAGMEEAFARLGERTRQLGLSLFIFDAQGGEVAESCSSCEFCKLIHERTGLRSTTVCEMAEQILATGQSATLQSALGCGVIGAPILRRRRLLGAAIACFPTREMCEEEQMARMCDRLKVDRQVVAGAASREFRHHADEADDLLRVVEWLLADEQSSQVAQNELRNLSTNLASTYEELSLLYRVSRSMKVSQGTDEFVQNVCDELLDVMNISAAAAVVYGYGSSTTDQVAVAGDLGMDGSDIKYLLTSRIAPSFGRELHATVDNQFAADETGPACEAVSNVIAIPLVVEGKLIGALMGLNRVEGDFDSVDLKLISSIAQQAEVFLANSRLYADMQDLLMGVLHALTATIDAKDRYTCGHSQRVALISKRLAEESGFSAGRIRQLYLAGLLHDIGKIGVSEAILCKEGKLTDEEYEEMQTHPVLGARILDGIRQLDDVVVGILYHHERPDGRGYPHGLRGDDVPFEGQIVGLADCFDAMTSDRTYRKALPLDVAIEEIRKNTGTQFNAKLVEKLLSLDLEAFLAEIRQPDKFLPFNLPRESMG